MTHSPPSNPALPHEPVDPLDALVGDLLDPNLSLIQVAARRRLSVATLTQLVAEPPIAAFLAEVHSFAADRIRLVSASQLPLAVATLNRILTNFSREESDLRKPTPEMSDALRANPTDASPASNTEPQHSRSSTLSPASLPPPALTPDQRQRRRETARRAATTLISLAGFSPLLSGQRPPPRTAPQPRALHHPPAPRIGQPSGPAPEAPNIDPKTPASAPPPNTVLNRAAVLPTAPLQTPKPVLSPTPLSTPTDPREKITQSSTNNELDPLPDLHSDLELPADLETDPNLVACSAAPHEHWP